MANNHKASGQGRMGPFAVVVEEGGTEVQGRRSVNRSSLRYCLVWLGAEVSEVMERAFGVVLAGRKMRPFELPTF